MSASLSPVKLLLCVVGAFSLAAVCFASGGVLYLYHGAPRVEVRRVLAQVQTLRENCTDSKEGPAGLTAERFNRAEFARVLPTLSAAKCPARFRAAWAEFVQACQVENEFGLRDLIVDVARGAGAESVHGALQREHSVKAAWFRVLAEAQRLGIEAPATGP